MVSVLFAGNQPDGMIKIKKRVWETSLYFQPPPTTLRQLLLSTLCCNLALLPSHYTDKVLGWDLTGSKNLS